MPHHLIASATESVEPRACHSVKRRCDPILSACFREAKRCALLQRGVYSVRSGTTGAAYPPPHLSSPSSTACISYLICLLVCLPISAPLLSIAFIISLPPPLVCFRRSIRRKRRSYHVSTSSLESHSRCCGSFEPRGRDSWSSPFPARFFQQHGFALAGSYSALPLLEEGQGRLCGLCGNSRWCGRQRRPACRAMRPSPGRTVRSPRQVPQGEQAH
jgi:hypothetical protein